MSRVPGTRKRPNLMVGLPPIDDDLDPHTKNAMAVRNAAWVTGQCDVCGATPELVPYPEFGLITATFNHDPDLCPVADLVDEDTPMIPMVVA